MVFIPLSRRGQSTISLNGNSRCEAFSGLRFARIHSFRKSPCLSHASRHIGNPFCLLSFLTPLKNSSNVGKENWNQAYSGKSSQERFYSCPMTVAVEIFHLV